MQTLSLCKINILDIHMINDKIIILVIMQIVCSLSTEHFSLKTPKEVFQHTLHTILYLNYERQYNRNNLKTKTKLTIY